MLLPLLGACAVVGPFRGPEWEPVRSLLSQDQSCKGPRCCGNLLVFCLFLIWQIQQYWYQLSRMRKRNITKVLPQRRTMFATRNTFSGTIPQFFTHGKPRGLDVHTQQWIQKQRWGYQRSVRQQWGTQYLLSPRNPCQDLPWAVHTSTEPIFWTSSFSSTCLLPQDNSWEAWQLPWYPTQAHPSLAICQRMEQLLAPSQKLLPGEPDSLRYTSTALAASLPNFPPAQSPNFCLREFRSDPLNQRLETPMKECLGSPQGPFVPWGNTEPVGREYSEITLQYLNKRESRREDAQEMGTSGVSHLTDSGVEENEEVKGLGHRNQRQERSEVDNGEISVPGWGRQDQVRTADREQTEKLRRKTQREPGEEKLSSRVHMGENRDQFRRTVDTTTQTPEWGDQETPAPGKKKEEEGRGKGEVNAQGLETQGWTESRAAENSQMLTWRTPDQLGGNPGTETEAEKGRNKDQMGSEDGVKIQTPGRENLGEFKQQDNEETQALGWEKQGFVRTEDEVQTPAGERGEQSKSEKDRKTQASKGENQSLSRQEVELGMRKLREVREEDWVVIQAPWWGSQRLVLMAADRGLVTLCWGHQSQVGGERTVDIPSLKSDRREGGDADTANEVVPKAKEQAQASETEMETYTVRSKDEESTEEEPGTDALAQGKRGLRGANGTDEAQTQKPGKENQGQLGNEFHQVTHAPKWKNQKQVRGNNRINNQTPEADNWGERTSKKGDTTHPSGCRAAEEVEGEGGTEVLIQGMGIVRGAGGEGGTETKAAVEESQSRLGDLSTNTHSSELKHQKEVGREGGAEAQAPEKRNRRELGDDDVKTQRPESQDQGQLAEAGGGCSERNGIWEQAKGENASENGALEKKNWRETGREDCRKRQRPRRKDQRQLGEVDGKTYRVERKNQENFRDGNDEEIQRQGKRNQRSFAEDDGSETQASVGEDQRQSVCENAEKSRTRGQRIHSKGRGAATEIQDVSVQRKCRVEDSKVSHPSRREDKGWVSRKDAVRPSPPNGSSERVGPTSQKCSSARPSSHTSGCGTPRHKQPMAGNGVDPAPCSEEHLSSQDTAPARKHRHEVSEPGSQRRQEKDKRMHPGKASSTRQHRYLQSQAPSVFPSLLCPQVSQTAPALAHVPVALTTLHKGPALKKSKHLLLESLMKRRIAHLRWGLPRRILESYLLFHFLESCSLPRAGMRLPGLSTDQERQRLQERQYESQASLLSLGSPARSPSRPVLEEKGSKLCTQVQALEKRRPTESEPMGRPIPPKKPRRIRPPGGAREPQIQEETPKAKIPAPRNPRPAVESRSCCDPGTVPEVSIEKSRSGKMVRPGVSQVEEKTSSRAEASCCPEGYSHQRKECLPREASELLTIKCQQPTCGRRGNEGPAEDGNRACSAHTSSSRGSVHSAADRLGMSIWNKMPWSTQLAKPQHSAPSLTRRRPTPPCKVGAPHTEEGSSRCPPASEKDLEPPRSSHTGVAPPKIESYEEHEAPGNSKGAPQNPTVSQKFGFMRHLRYFLRQYGLK